MEADNSGYGGAVWKLPGQNQWEPGLVSGREMLGSHIYLGAEWMGLVYGLDKWVREEESMSPLTSLELFKNPSNITFLVQLSLTLVYTPIATLVCMFVCFSHVCFPNRFITASPYGPLCNWLALTWSLFNGQINVWQRKADRIEIPTHSLFDLDQRSSNHRAATHHHRAVLTTSPSPVSSATGKKNRRSLHLLWFCCIT